METIRVELAERSYDISIGTDVLKKIKDNLKSFDLSPKIAIVSNPTVFSLYGKPVLNAVTKAGFDAVTIIIPMVKHTRTSCGCSISIRSSLPINSTGHQHSLRLEVELSVI